MTTGRLGSLIGLVMLLHVAGSLGGALETVGQLAAGYDGPLRSDDDGRPHQGDAGMDAGMDPRTGNTVPPAPSRPTVSSTTLPRVDRIPERMPGHER